MAETNVIYLCQKQQKDAVTREFIAAHRDLKDFESGCLEYIADFEAHKAALDPDEIDEIERNFYVLATAIALKRDELERMKQRLLQFK